MEKLAIKGHQFRRKLVRSILGFFSLSGMLFIFQACYGTPQDFGQDLLIEGTVRNENSDQVLSNIEVKIQNMPQYTRTDGEGRFSLYCPFQENLTIVFSDIDGAENGWFETIDSVLKTDPSNSVIQLSIALPEK